MPGSLFGSELDDSGGARVSLEFLSRVEMGMHELVPWRWERAAADDGRGRALPAPGLVHAALEGDGERVLREPGAQAGTGTGHRPAGNAARRDDPKLCM